MFSTLRHLSDPTPTPMHALPPLLQTTAQYNPNLFNGTKHIYSFNQSFSLLFFIACHPPPPFSRPFPLVFLTYFSLRISSHLDHPLIPIHIILIIIILNKLVPLTMVDTIQQQLHLQLHHHVSRSERQIPETISFHLAYGSRTFLPATTASNSIPENQPISYPQTSPLAAHRPTRPTAVVPPLPKDPVISSPIGQMTTTSSMIPPISNYQQVSPQKSSNNYSKQVNNFDRKENLVTRVFSRWKFKSHMNQTVRRTKNFSYCPLYLLVFSCLDRSFAIITWICK